jgi:hypothetical protein
MKVFWNKDYTSVGYNFDTTKKSDNIVEIIKSKELENINIVDPSEIHTHLPVHIRTVSLHQSKM